MTTETPMMACGHAANASYQDGPACAICVGIRGGATTVVEAPDLAGREARCAYCGRTAPSSTRLGFFEHRPDAGHDSYYCGCRGWD